MILGCLSMILENKRGVEIYNEKKIIQMWTNPLNEFFAFVPICIYKIYLRMKM